LTAIDGIGVHQICRGSSGEVFDDDLTGPEFIVSEEQHRLDILYLSLWFIGLRGSISVH